MSKRAKPKPGADAKKPVKAPEATFRPFTALRALRDRLPDTEAPAPPPPKPVPKPIDAEDEALALYRMMNGVTPLATKATRLPKTQARAPESQLEAKREAALAPVTAQDDAVHAQLRALVEGGRFEVEDDGRRVEGRRQGVTPDVVRRLRRGQLPIDGRLDLHGETAVSAPLALEKFLKAQRMRGERCVLVVHGKGAHSPGGVGILRGEMAAWLSQGPASGHVAAFATATDDDGGEGAVYVLLTR